MPRGYATQRPLLYFEDTITRNPRQALHREHHAGEDDHKVRQQARAESFMPVIILIISSQMWSTGRTMYSRARGTRFSFANLVVLERAGERTCTDVTRLTKISEALCLPPPTSPTTLPSLPLSACPSGLIPEFYEVLRTRRAKCFRPIALLRLEEFSGPKTEVKGPITKGK